jgi:hypothetical protein
MKENCLFFCEITDCTDRNTFCGYIPSVQNEKDLLDEAIKALNITFETGRNWDALCELYRDFNWIEQKNIKIFHLGLSLMSMEDIRIYSNIVKITCDFWKYIPDHDVFFYFSLYEKDLIYPLLL